MRPSNGEDENLPEVPTPSDQLAGLAFDGLAEKGLLRIDRRGAVIAKLATGKMTQEDWSLELELAAAQGAL